MDHHHLAPRTTAFVACLLAVLSGAALPATSQAAETDANPLRFYQSGDSRSYLQASLGLDLAFFSHDNVWYGTAKERFGTDIDSWWESVLRAGIEGKYVLPSTQTVYGKVDAVQANTFDGVDACGTNADLGDVSSLRIDKAYVGWRSGNLFNTLGEDFLDLSFGRQTYTTGTLFLFGSEGGAGGKRAAYYLGGRKSADYAAIARLKSGPWSGDLFYFDNDSPFPINTEAGGATVEYAFSPSANLGGSVAALESDAESRDGMRIYDLRGSVKPFESAGGPAALQPLKLDAEYVYQDRDEDMEEGVGWYVRASYQWAELPWKPELTYHYASFDEGYDVLFYSATDWGSWFQGEITGEYDLFNENLDTHMIRLKVQPVEPLAINLFYYKFSLHSPEAMAVASDDYVDEWNLIFDWTVTKHLTLSLVGAYAIPDDGAKERFGDDEDWKAGMMMASVRF